MCLFISKCHLPARAPHCCWVCWGWCCAGLGLREFSSNELQMGSPNRPRVQARGCEGDLLCVVVCHELTLITPGRGSGHSHRAHLSSLAVSHSGRGGSGSGHGYQTRELPLIHCRLVWDLLIISPHSPPFFSYFL